MTEAVSQVIAERERLERGLSRAFLLSGVVHFTLLAVAIGVPILFPHQPRIDVTPGFAVPLPPGGRGTPNANPAPAASTPPQPEPPKPQAKPEPPPKILKPPKEAPRKGLPLPDAKKARGRPERTPPPPVAKPGGVPGGTGTSTQTPGLEFGPAGPGVPGGTDMMGDWYLAGVQRKIWVLWAQQIKQSFTNPVGVMFTITADGGVEDVRVTQSSGVYLLDSAAQRAVISAAPFGPLPKHYGTNRYTIQAVFRPTQ